MTASTEEAQRELERRALRNVRGLVDRMEGAEARERRMQRRLLAVIAAIIAVIAVSVTWVVYRADQRARPPAAVEPDKLPPIKAGPRR